MGAFRRRLILPLLIACLVAWAQGEIQEFNEEIISRPDEESDFGEDQSSLKIRRETGVALGWTPNAGVGQVAKRDAEVDTGEGGDEVDQAGTGTDVGGGETDVDEITPQEPPSPPIQKRKRKKKNKKKWGKKQKKNRKKYKKNKYKKNKNKRKRKKSRG